MAFASLTANSKLAYLTTSYPSVSHTFIRREILGLEALGYSVLRVAIRTGDAVVEPVDKTEQTKTLHLLAQPPLVLCYQILRGMIRARGRVIGGFRAAWRMNRRSERGLFRHMAYLAEGLALLAYFHEKNVSHVHVHFGTNAAAVAMLVRLMGGPTYSMTVHGPDEFDAPIGLSLGLKMENAEFTAAISSYCASQLRRWVAYPQWRKIHIIRCCVDETWFERASPVNDEANLLVSVARLSAQKGHLFLIDAYADAVRTGLRSRLVLVGDGELRGAIERQIEEHGLGGRVEILGWQDSAKIQQIILSSRALVLPSFAEGLPVVLMEAMALTRPVLSTYIAGVPELVRDGREGWLVVAGDREGLKDALLSIDAIPVEQLRKMGEQAQARVRSRHSISVEAGKLDYLLRRYVPGIGGNEIPLEVAHDRSNS